ncbi:MAG: hypothetical protein ACR2FQ_12365 [Pseudonocardiaceae bacterium]
MAYLVSFVIVAVAVFVLAGLVVRTLGPARRAARSARDTRAAVSEVTGLLAARAAALRVEVDRRRSSRADRSGM